MTNFELRKYYGCDCVEVDEIDVDNMLSVSLPSLGKHTVRCIDWQAVKATYTSDHEPDERPAENPAFRPRMITQPYIDVIFRDVKTGEVIATKIYSAGVVMFMRNINDQLNGSMMGKPLSAMLDDLKTKDVNLWIEWDKKYGQQAKFYHK